MTLIERLRDMTHRTNRHNYQHGEYWNAIDEAADQLELEREAAKGLVEALEAAWEVRDMLNVPPMLGRSGSEICHKAIQRFLDLGEKSLTAYKARTEGK